jgi:hypothetical protein
MKLGIKTNDKVYFNILWIHLMMANYKSRNMS